MQGAARWLHTAIFWRTSTERRACACAPCENVTAGRRQQLSGTNEQDFQFAVVQNGAARGLVAEHGYGTGTRHFIFVAGRFAFSVSISVVRFELGSGSGHRCVVGKLAVLESGMILLHLSVAAIGTVQERAGAGM